MLTKIIGVYLRESVANFTFVFQNLYLLSLVTTWLRVARHLTSEDVTLTLNRNLLTEMSQLPYPRVARIISAKTPAAVTSAPAPAPLTTKGCSL